METKKAFIASLPVLAGYLVLGMGFGIMMYTAGYGLLWVVAMSLLIFSGTLQYAGVGLLAAPAGFIQAAITSLVINARYMFYSISMLKKFKNSGKYKPYLIFALTDETYAILNDGTPEGCDENRYRFLVSLFNHSYWIAGGIFGNLLGRVLPFSSHGLEFSMTAIFVASFTEQWISGKNRFSASVGVITTLVCLIIFRAKWFLIPSMLIITLILTFFGKRRVEEV